MALSDLTSAINGWEAALAADAINPLQSYSLDGEAVTRETWRKSLLDAIEIAKHNVNGYSPINRRTRFRVV